MNEHAVGTLSGYHWHRRRGQRPCEPCGQAHARHMQRWRDRQNPERATARVPLLLLARLLELAPPEARNKLVNELGDVAERAHSLAEHKRGMSSTGQAQRQPIGTDM